MTKNQKNAAYTAGAAASVVMIVTLIMETRRVKKATGILDEMAREAAKAE